MEPDPLARARADASRFLVKRVALWAVLVAFMLGIVIAAALNPSDEARTGLVAFLWDTPGFLLEVLAIYFGVLLIDFLANELRNAEWFDHNGAARELGAVRARVGTEAERHADAAACAWQFLARNVIIAAAILGFFLAKSSG